MERIPRQKKPKVCPGVGARRHNGRNIQTGFEKGQQTPAKLSTA
jgi:hypothetical protein